MTFAGHYGILEKFTKEFVMGKSSKTFGLTYFLAAVGAAVFYVQQSTTLWMGALGVLKGLVWPAIVTYRAFELLNL